MERLTRDAKITRILAGTNEIPHGLREGTPLGAIIIRRMEVRLLKTFADQALIAIENVRLFKELEARTGELTQSVEKFTALGEVSRAVSSTLDVETVLNTIVSRAGQLSGADGCSIYEYNEATAKFQVRATHNLDAAIVETLRMLPLRKGEGLMGRVADSREPTQIPDIAQAGAYQSRIRDLLIGAGYRALLSIPLLREDQVIGSLSFNRKAPGVFPPEVVDVLTSIGAPSTGCSRSTLTASRATRRAPRPTPFILRRFYPARAKINHAPDPDRADVEPGGRVGAGSHRRRYS